MTSFEHILNRLNSIDARLARIEATVAAHDERSKSHHSRLEGLEEGDRDLVKRDRKILWTLLIGGASFATTVTVTAIQYLF